MTVKNLVATTVSSREKGTKEEGERELTTSSQEDTIKSKEKY